MPATFRTFLNGLAQGMQYIPDILQDIAIQKQRQQQIDLGVREQQFKEDVYKEGAKTRELTEQGLEQNLRIGEQTIEHNEFVNRINSAEAELKEFTLPFLKEKARADAEMSEHDRANHAKTKLQEYRKIEQEITTLISQASAYSAEQGRAFIETKVAGLKLFGDVVKADLTIGGLPDNTAKTLLEGTGNTVQDLKNFVNKVNMSPEAKTAVLGLFEPAELMMQTRLTAYNNGYYGHLAKHPRDTKGAKLAGDATLSITDSFMKPYWQSIGVWGMLEIPDTEDPLDIDSLTGAARKFNKGKMLNQTMQGWIKETDPVQEKINKINYDANAPVREMMGNVYDTGQKIKSNIDNPSLIPTSPY